MGLRTPVPGWPRAVRVGFLSGVHYASHPGPYQAASIGVDAGAGALRWGALSLWPWWSQIFSLPSSSVLACAAVLQVVQGGHPGMGPW